METPSVKWLKPSAIENAAWEFLKQNKSHEKIPVNVELIAEKNGINIIELPELQRSASIEGFITSDFSSIYIDQSISRNVPVRGRFTIAHELGHMVLHNDIYSKYSFSSITDWIEFQEEINEKTYGSIEWQGYSFAGCLLVPKFFLDDLFKINLDSVFPLIDDAKFYGMDRDSYLNSAISFLADKMAPAFDVSTEVVNRRVHARTDLMNLIP